MGALIESDKRTARRKGFTAAAVAGGSVLVAATLSVPLGIIGLLGAGYLGVDWFMYRAKRGMRF